ncbi:hypothetical protein ISN45_Aa08g005780, partial [Arabidopsis thaliana x Arabidopsis arenosa]
CQTKANHLHYRSRKISDESPIQTGQQLTGKPSGRQRQKKFQFLSLKNTRERRERNL